VLDVIRNVASEISQAVEKLCVGAMLVFHACGAHVDFEFESMIGILPRSHFCVYKSLAAVRAQPGDVQLLSTRR
jgi:hypothetical protein